MKREELKDLGLTDEQLGSVMALHGKTVNELTTKLDSAEAEREQYKEQLDTNQQEFNELKKSAEGNAELTSQLKELQDKFDSVQSEADNKLNAQRKDYAIRLALKDSATVDEDIVLSLLDKDTIKVTEEGLQGFNEQLDSIKENKGFLFQQAEPKEDEAKPTIDRKSVV